jgi:hypothetical protein
MGAIASAWGVPLALMIGALVTLVIGIGGWFWLGRIRATAAARGPERIRTTIATADIGAIDPEGRSAGPVSTAPRPR